MSLEVPVHNPHATLPLWRLCSNMTASVTRGGEGQASTGPRPGSLSWTLRWRRSRDSLTSWNMSPGPEAFPGRQQLIQSSHCCHLPPASCLRRLLLPCRLEVLTSVCALKTRKKEWPVPPETVQWVFSRIIVSLKQEQKSHMF